jgi:hypothetical protein
MPLCYIECHAEASKTAQEVIDSIGATASMTMLLLLLSHESTSLEVPVAQNCLLYSILFSGLQTVKTFPHKKRLFMNLMSHVFRITFSYSDRSCRFFS